MNTPSKPIAPRDDELPPLPEPSYAANSVTQEYYRADDMRDYARAALAAAAGQVEQREAEIMRLAEAMYTGGATRNPDGARQARRDLRALLATTPQPPQVEPRGELTDEVRLRIAAKRAADALPDCIKFFDGFCAENTNPYISRAAQAAFIAKRTLPGILGDLLAALSAQQPKDNGGNG